MISDFLCEVSTFELINKLCPYVCKLPPYKIHVPRSSGLSDISVLGEVNIKDGGVLILYSSQK